MTTSTSTILLTKRQTAEALGISVRTVERLIQAGDLPAVRLGMRVTRIARTDLAAFVEQRRGTAA